MRKFLAKCRRDEAGQVEVIMSFFLFWILVMLSLQGVFLFLADRTLQAGAQQVASKCAISSSPTTVQQQINTETAKLSSVGMSGVTIGPKTPSSSTQGYALCQIWATATYNTLFGFPVQLHTFAQMAQQPAP